MQTWKKAAAALILMGLGACKRGTMDTTKDVYDDSDAPEYQIYEVNGEVKKIPWNEVPEERRWFTEPADSKLPWKTYKVHVPIVSILITAKDKDGNPVDPDGKQVWDGRFLWRGLNPSHSRTGILGNRH